MSSSISPPSRAILVRMYTGPVIIVSSAIAWLIWVLTADHHVTRPELIIAPIVGLFTLTGLVWFIMVVVRNFAFIRGHASIRYFADYKTEVPVDDRLERPARTFNNLMQVPTLFYIICVLMFVTRTIDDTQIMLAWTFVLLRWFHAGIYIIFNWVPYRFAFWTSSCIFLGALWVRFITQASLG